MSFLLKKNVEKCFSPNGLTISLFIEKHLPIKIFRYSNVEEHAKFTPHYEAGNLLFRIKDGKGSFQK